MTVALWAIADRPSGSMAPTREPIVGGVDEV